jgi:NAD+ kinase
MKWGIVCKPKNGKTFSLASEVYEFLLENGEVFPEKVFADNKKIKGYSLKEINDKADIVVTVGGDGTILWALREVEKPIFSINSGGMGFLAEVESKYAIGGLKKVIEGDYNIEERYKLKVMLDGIRLPDATNEVTVQTGNIAKIIYLQIFVEEELLGNLAADGVIIASPTGSTSYALSVGGPIMDPAVNAMIVAPLAPFRLSARPWVIPIDKKIKIKIQPKSKETKLVIDGNNNKEVDEKSEIIITGSGKKARFIRFGESFYQMVRLKLVR